MRWLGIKKTVKLGVKSLWMHRLRSTLTMLGIIFGVCSVIAMLAIGEGASREAQAAIAALNGQPYGGRTLTVNEARPRAERSGGGRGGYGGGRGGGGGGRGGGGGGGGRRDRY